MAISTFFAVALLSLSMQPPAGHAGGHGALDSSTLRGSGVILQQLPEDRQNLPQTRTNANGERLVCRQIDSSTGRTGSRRVCLTAAEWRARNGD